MNKKRFPSFDVSLGISAEEMVVGGSLNVSLDTQQAGATSQVLNPQLFTVMTVLLGRKVCQAQRAGKRLEKVTTSISAYSSGEMHLSVGAR